MKDTHFQLKWDLDPSLGPLSRQLSRQIRETITAGELVPGDRLPATRRLAVELGIARGTVTTAIELLIAEGILESKTGSGTFVAFDATCSTPSTEDKGAARFPAPLIIPAPNIETKIKCTIDFRPCRPSLEFFPQLEWRRCMSQATSVLPIADYGDARGEAELRDVICEYLRRARGLKTSPEEIIITNGAVHAMHLLSALYLDKNSTVVVENPGFLLAHQTFALHGAKVFACDVDENGLKTECLPKTSKNVKFVYVTPSHQFPTGSRLSLGRRRELIKWAAKNNVLILEDDYDGEFRYDVPPLAPMATMDPNRVVYCGTFSKTMFPGLRMGFAVAPKPIIDAMAAYRTISEYAPNSLVQHALARFIRDGHYEKHIHRMRRIYAAKRKSISVILDELDVGVELTGLDSGLSVLMDLKEFAATQMSATMLSENAKRQGILTPSVKHFDIKGNLPDDALVLGYAEPSLQNIKTGITKIFADIQ